MLRNITFPPSGLLDSEERLHVSEWRVQPGVANGSSDEKYSGGISYFCAAKCEIRSTIWDFSVIYIVYIAAIGRFRRQAWRAEKVSIGAFGCIGILPSHFGN